MFVSKHHGSNTPQAQNNNWAGQDGSHGPLDKVIAVALFPSSHERNFSRMRICVTRKSIVRGISSSLSFHWRIAVLTLRPIGRRIQRGHHGAIRMNRTMEANTSCSRSADFCVCCIRWVCLSFCISNTTTWTRI